MGSPEGSRRREKDSSKVVRDDEYSFKDEGERFGKPVLITHCGCEAFFETVIVEHLGWNDIFADDWEIYEGEE